ncbi:MAG: hypothetical protein JW884_10180 [Deltaproteobacteria bacterium]|nr:hypothetical protein [Deltaproteobacteria bacterium]
MFLDMIAGLVVTRHVVENVCFLVLLSSGLCKGPSDQLMQAARPLWLCGSMNIEAIENVGEPQVFSKDETIAKRLSDRSASTGDEALNAT